MHIKDIYVEQLGHTITHDWTSDELEYNDYHERSIRCAQVDIKGVCDTDLVIAIMTDDLYQYKGTRHELGAAFALKHQSDMGLIHLSLCLDCFKR